MFNITTRKDIVNIQLTRGDTAVIETIPVIDVDEDGKITDVDQPITLSGDDKVLFCVGSATGRIYLKKVLTANDYDDAGTLAIPSIYSLSTTILILLICLKAEMLTPTLRVFLV